MTYTVPVTGIGGDWQFTLPDYVTLRQGDGTQPLHLNGTDPLSIDVHYTPDALLRGDAHGMVIIHATDLPGAVNDADVTNGLRGTVKITFHNDLPTDMNDTANGATTMLVMLASASDNFGADPTNGGHPQYVHFHGVDASDFPALQAKITTQQTVSSTTFNPTAGAVNYLDLSGHITAHSQVAFGDMTLHQRDRNATDDSFDLSFFLTADAINDSAVTQAQQQLGSLPQHAYLGPDNVPDSFFYFIFRANDGDFYTGHTIENTGLYTVGTTFSSPNGQYQIIDEQPYGYDISSTMSPLGQPWGTAYDDGRVFIDGYHDSRSGADYGTTYFSHLHDTLSNTISAGTHGLGSEIDYVDRNGKWEMFGEGGYYLLA